MHVELSGELSEEQKSRLTRNLALARELGAEVITTTGYKVEEALLRIARQNNVTQIVVGKSLGHPVFDFLRGGSLVDRIVRRSGDIDVYVVRAEGEEGRQRVRFQDPARFAPLREYVIGAAAVGLLTALCWLLAPLTGYWTVSLIYLTAVLIGGLVLSRGPVFLVGALSALLWNFLFIPPLYTFYIGKPEDALMFFIYFVVALVVGHLTSQLKEREQSERSREQRATALYQFVRAAAAAPSLDSAFAAAASQINHLLRADSCICFDPAGGSDLIPYPPSLAAFSKKEEGVAAWVFSHGNPAGRFTDTLREAEALYIPIKRLKETIGVLRVQVAQNATLSLGERQLLEAFSDQLATVIERDRLAQLAHRAKMSEEAERLHKTLLDCVSHELKTPIAAISAATENLLSQASGENRREMAAEIQHAARRLNRVVNHLLDMTRIETGVLKPKLEWCEVPELLNAAVEAEHESLTGHPIEISTPEMLPLVHVDFSLLEQALSKLLANAASYSTARTTITLSAALDGDTLKISVLDRGCGLPETDPDRVFTKFFRGEGARTGGLGLGLSIARGFVELHGGRITAANRAQGGAEFTIQLPVETMPLKSIGASA